MYDKPFYYKNGDYTVRMEITDGVKRYFIKYHGLKDTPEHEISLEIFMLYFREFNKPLDNQRTEHRRHIEDGDIEFLIMSGKLTYTHETDDNLAVKCSIDAVLETCTPIQQRRFKLYYVHGYTFAEIARFENCAKQRIKKSVDSVLEKIKKYFSR